MTHSHDGGDSARQPLDIDRFLALTGLKRDVAVNAISQMNGHVDVALASLVQGWRRGVVTEDLFDNASCMTTNACEINRRLQALYAAVRQMTHPESTEGLNDEKAAWSSYVAEQPRSVLMEAKEVASEEGCQGEREAERKAAEMDPHFRREAAAASPPPTLCPSHLNPSLPVERPSLDGGCFLHRPSFWMEAPGASTAEGCITGRDGSMEVSEERKSGTEVCFFGPGQDWLRRLRAQLRPTQLRPAGSAADPMPWNFRWLKWVRRCTTVPHQKEMLAAAVHDGDSDPQPHQEAKQRGAPVVDSSFVRHTMPMDAAGSDTDPMARSIHYDGLRLFNEQQSRSEFAVVLYSVCTELGHYCASMSFVAGLCLLGLNHAETAVVMRTADHLLPGHWSNLPSGFACAAYVVEMFIRDFFPDVVSALRSRQIFPEIYMGKILNALGVPVLPVDVLFDFFDEFLEHGLDWLIRFEVAIVARYRHELLSLAAAADDHCFRLLFDIMELRRVPIEQVSEILRHAKRIHLGPKSSELIQRRRVQVLETVITPRLTQSRRQR